MERREVHVGIEKARAKLGELAAAVAAGGPPIVVTRRGRPLAVLVSLAEFARIQAAEPGAPD